MMLDRASSTAAQPRRLDAIAVARSGGCPRPQAPWGVSGKSRGSPRGAPSCGGLCGSVWDDVFLCWLGQSGWLEHTPFAHALASELDPVGIVNDAVEDGVGKRGIADDLMPAVNGRLTGDNERAGVVAKRDGVIGVIDAKTRLEPGLELSTSAAG